MKSLDVVVVVSGVPRPATVTESEKLHKLVKEVLRESGDSGRQINEFELRTEGGALLALDLTVREAGIHSGQTLFLNPVAGAGG